MSRLPERGEAALAWTRDRLAVKRHRSTSGLGAVLSPDRMRSAISGHRSARSKAIARPSTTCSDRTRQSPSRRIEFHGAPSINERDSTS